MSCGQTGGQPGRREPADRVTAPRCAVGPEARVRRSTWDWWRGIRRRPSSCYWSQRHPLTGVDR